MNDMILVSAYTDTDLKRRTMIEQLRALNAAREMGATVLVVNRAPYATSPPWCDVFLHDKDNPVVHDPELQYSFLNVHWTDDAVHRITYKDYAVTATHVLPIVKTIAQGAALARSMGIKKVHLMDYDYPVRDVDEIIDNSRLLDKLEVVFYFDQERGIMLNNLVSFRVDSIRFPSAAELWPGADMLLAAYRNTFTGEEWFPERFIGAHVFGSMAMSGLDYVKQFDEQSSFGASTVNSWSEKISTCLYQVDGWLHLYAWNEHGGDYRIRVVVDGRPHDFEVPSADTWTLQPLGERLEGVRIIDFCFNGRLVRRFYMDRQAGVDMITKHATYTYERR